MFILLLKEFPQRDNKVVPYCIAEINTNRTNNVVSYCTLEINTNRTNKVESYCIVEIDTNRTNSNPKQLDQASSIKTQLHQSPHPSPTPTPQKESNNEITSCLKKQRWTDLSRRLSSCSSLRWLRLPLGLLLLHRSG